MPGAAATHSEMMMNDDAEALQRRIVELEAQLHALQAAPARAPTILSPSAERDINIATNQTIAYFSTVIYGSDTTAEQQEQLARYLRRLAARLQRLPLRGLAARLDEGQGMLLAKVYVMLATRSRSEIVCGSRAELQHKYFISEGHQQRLKDEYSPNWALPPDAVVEIKMPLLPNSQPSPEHGSAQSVYRDQLYRGGLATEAVQQSLHLVLLGDPGGGKSTFVRHLAWALARRGLGDHDTTTALFGWQDETILLPVLLPLRALAGRIAAEGATPAAVSAALRDEMEREYDARAADALLDQALAHGAALLLLDGLDEVPLEAIPGVSADRLTTVRAIRDFADLHAGARIVVTCRTRAFDEALRAELNWHVETIVPFTLGQVRHFVAEWYAALAERGAIGRDLGVAQSQALINTIASSERLRALAANPLLLTMMALILAEQGALPRDRPLLYERILEQLLGQWDQHKGAASLAETIGAPNLRGDDLRAILDRLSYEAHVGATSPDGRGRLAAKELRYALASFFAQIKVDGAWEAAGRCLAYFNERSGLLQPEDDGEFYAFARLTLQEYGAGRHMLLQHNAVELVMERRGDDGWREPIALGLGVVHRLYPMLADRIDRVLTELIDPDEAGRPKPRVRWYRDLILAAELGQERDWNLLRALISVDRLERDLRRGLVALLADPAQPLPVAERVRAGFLLGALGDPRFPITIEEWRHEIAGARAGRVDGYFCPVPLAPGSLRLWIARYPITNAQLQECIRTVRLPPRHTRIDDNFNGLNQPAAGVSWHLASEFCVWLSQQTQLAIRLPSEMEWEIAARGQDQRRYPWGERRFRDRAATKEDHDLRGWPYTVPVGCYPAGASAVGALDMAGNVWEWTSDRWQPEAGSRHAETDAARVLRGGGYLGTKKQTLTTARIGLAPRAGFDSGFRVVLEIEGR